MAPRAIRSNWTAAICLLFAVLSTPGCCRFRPTASDQGVVQARQLSLQGIEAVDEGRAEEAERIFAEAVKACPSDERARHHYAERLWDRGERREGVVQMEHAVRLSEGDPTRIVRLGEMYLSQSRDDAADRCAKAALAKNNRLPSAWALAGKVHENRGELDAALSDYLRSLAYASHQPDLHMAVAEIYRRQNRPQRALSTLESLADQYPPGEAPADVDGLQGLALSALGRHENAIERLTTAVSAQPDSPRWMCELAAAHRAAGDVASSEATLQRALDIDPESPRARQLLAEWGSSSPTVAEAENQGFMR